MSRKIPAPNYSYLPNELFDYWLPIVNGDELRVLVAIAHKTFNHRTTPDEISMFEIVKVTGLLENAVKNALESLEIRGCITRKEYGYVYGQEDL